MPEFKLTYRDVIVREYDAESPKAAVREAMRSASVADSFHRIDVYPKLAGARAAVPPSVLHRVTWCVKIPVEIIETLFKSSEREALSNFLFNGNLPDSLDFSKLTIERVEASFAPPAFEDEQPPEAPVSPPARKANL